MIFNKKHAKIQSEIALETIENENFRRCAALSSKKPFKMNWFWYTKNAAKRRKKFRGFSKKIRGGRKISGVNRGFEKFPGWKISGVKKSYISPCIEPSTKASSPTHEMLSEELNNIGMG